MLLGKEPLLGLSLRVRIVMLRLSEVRSALKIALPVLPAAFGDSIDELIVAERKRKKERVCERGLQQLLRS